MRNVTKMSISLNNETFDEVTRRSEQPNSVAKGWSRTVDRDLTRYYSLMKDTQSKIATLFSAEDFSLVTETWKEYRGSQDTLFPMGHEKLLNQFKAMTYVKTLPVGLQDFLRNLSDIETAALIDQMDQKLIDQRREALV